MAAVDMWDEVVDLMGGVGHEARDGFLFTVSEHLRGDVENHKHGGDGCDACRGEIELCGRWESAQEVMLTWLMQQRRAVA